MAAKTGIAFDGSEWDSAIAQLGGEFKTSLARSMAVAGGKVLRDEAKRQVRKRSGLLESAIYVAFKDELSNESQVVYSVSWNHKLAPHGHWEEFGHWMPFLTFYNEETGDFVSIAKGKGGGASAVPMPGGPKWIPAHPFLRPAYDIAKSRAANAMVERGRERAAELLAEIGRNGN